VSAVDVRAVRVYELPEGGTAWPTVGLCLVALALQAASTAASIAGVWPVPLAIAVNTACAYAQFTVLHDAIHRSVSRRDWINEPAGVVATFVLCGPFEAMRRNHLHHHAHTNDPRQDPDYWAAGETWLGTAARCLTMLQYHYYSYFRRLRRRDGALLRAVGTSILIAAIHFSAWKAGFLLTLVLHWTVPAQLAVALLALTFDYWPHRPHTERGRFKDTANLLPVWFDPLFLCQNLHAVHHLFPQLPWYRYREAMNAVAPGLRAEGVPQWGFVEAVKKLKPSPLPKS
jgi:beta-carotene hydroxylase